MLVGLFLGEGERMRGYTASEFGSRLREIGWAMGWFELVYLAGGAARLSFRLEFSTRFLAFLVSWSRQI
jgi:hypothetical protein